MTGDESEPLIITVTSDWEVKQTSSLVTGAIAITSLRSFFVRQYIWDKVWNRGWGGGSVIGVGARVMVCETPYSISRNKLDFSS